MYFGSNRLNDTWSIHTEVQYRNHEVVPNTVEQLLLRTGVNYHFKPNAFATLGYGHITSHSYLDEIDQASSAEHRVWQQLITTQKLGRVKLEHRYRIEQRWISTLAGESFYKDRLRYRLMAFVPINKPTLDPGALFLGAYDEIFLDTRGSFFDRNRLYAALGYQFSKSTSVQVGAMRQRVGAFGKWYAQFAIVFNPVLGSK